MTAHRVVTLAAVLIVACVSGAAAQFSGFPQPNNPCAAFGPIQQDAQKTLTELKTANERKAPREEFCQMFQRLALSTGKMVKFLEQNKLQCNVPAEAVQRAKTEYAKSLTFRKQACSTAPAGSGTPSLSDVLGAPILPDSSSTTKPNMGTFNTLTGNPLER
jgi:hypothetical protein